MSSEGPLLETLTRRLAECPPDFLAEPRLGRKGQVQVPAVVADLLRDLGGPPLTPAEAQAFTAPAASARNGLRLVLLACWLLHADWFCARPQLAEAARQFLRAGLGELAELVQVSTCVADADRREEFVRVCLQGLDLHPAGETVAQAQDRLATLNTAERQRVIRASQKAEARAREIREAMAREAAREAQMKVTRE